MRAARFGVTSFGVTGIPFGCTNTAITEFVICRPSLAQGVPLSMIHSTPILSNADYSFGQKIRWLRLLWRTLQDRRLYRVADAILAQSAAKAPVVLDIGANVGAFSRAFVKAGRRPGLVLAFEPSSYVFSILQIVTRRLHQVQCHKIALSSAAGSGAALGDAEGWRADGRGTRSGCSAGSATAGAAEKGGSADGGGTDGSGQSEGMRGDTAGGGSNRNDARQTEHDLHLQRGQLFVALFLHHGKQRSYFESLGVTGLHGVGRAGGAGGKASARARCIKEFGEE